MLRSGPKQERGDWGRSRGCAEVWRSKGNVNASFQSVSGVRNERGENFCLWNICSLKYKKQKIKWGKCRTMRKTNKK